jgi:hypothetical protein
MRPARRGRGGYGAVTLVRHNSSAEVDLIGSLFYQGDEEGHRIATRLADAVNRQGKDCVLK